MKAVQIGILAALLVCAGLLYTVYRGQKPAEPAQTAAQTAPAAAEPAAAPAPAEAAPAPAAVPAAVEKPAAPVEKPSPAPVVRPKERKRTSQVAEARPPAPAAQPAAAPAPAVEQAPAPVETRPAVPAATAVEPAPAAPVEKPREPQRVTIPAGTTVTVRLAESINSDRRQPGETFSATLDQPLIIDGLAIAERGAKVQGKIVEAQQAGRVRGLSSIALQLTSLHTSDGQNVPLVTERFTKEGEKSTGDDAKKVGIGAAIGAAVGAIAGGGKGAAIGAGVGGAAGAGTVAATRGKPVELPVETRLTFKLEQPVTVTERIP